MTLASASCSLPLPNAKEPSSPFLGATVYITPPQSCSQTMDIQKRIYSLNAYIHFKGKEGWTMPQIQDVFN
jgi:hypothetical protein